MLTAGETACGIFRTNHPIISKRPINLLRTGKLLSSLGTDTINYEFLRSVHKLASAAWQFHAKVKFTSRDDTFVLHKPFVEVKKFLCKKLNDEAR